MRQLLIIGRAAIAYRRRSGGLIDNKNIVVALRDRADDFSAAGRPLLASGGRSLVFWLGKGMINYHHGGARYGRGMALIRAEACS
jgi:hypothetical protein